MTQTIYGLTQDYGDGSAGMRWFRNKSIAFALLDENSPLWDQSMYANEGVPSMVLTFPGDLDLEACGFQFDDCDYSCGAQP
jgi:hypothetical protein